MSEGATKELRRLPKVREFWRIFLNFQRIRGFFHIAGVFDRLVCNGMG